MAMYDDYAMYYSDSWVAYKQGDELLPFYINGTDYCGDGYSDDNELYQNHTKGLATTQFRGMILTNEQGRTEELNVMGDDPNLILEPQDLGYIKNNQGNWVWTTTTIWYSVKKGLISPRLYNRNPMQSNTMIYRMFNIKPDGQELLHRDLVHYDNKLEYKGAVVGELVDGVMMIEKEYAIFAPWFSGLLHTCQVQIKTQQTN